MNDYTIYTAKAIDGIQVDDWTIYFKTVTYAEGIRFLQVMNNIVNAKFTMLKTKNTHNIMSEFDAADQAGQVHPYDQEHQ